MYRLWTIDPNGRQERTMETRKSRKSAVALCDYWQAAADREGTGVRYDLRWEG